MEFTSESMPNSFKITPTMLEGSDAGIKIRVMKEVRKPLSSKKRKNKKIMKKSSLFLRRYIQGPMEIQKYFIEFAIREGARFKNRVLIQHLERTLEEFSFIP